MSLEGIEKLLERAREARKAKQYLEEYEYLEKAYNINPNNTRVLNALVRNAKKTGDNLGWERWLLKLVELKPTGENLRDLLKVSSVNNQESVNEKELLLRRLEVEPGNKKVLKRLEEIKKEEVAEQIAELREFRSQPLIDLDDETYELVRYARGCIYSDLSIADKEMYLKYTFCSEEEILISLLAELFKSCSLNQFGIKMLKRYKKEANEMGDALKVRLANRLIEMVLNHKTMYGTWEQFWLENRNKTREKETKRLVKVDNN